MTPDEFEKAMQQSKLSSEFHLWLYQEKDIMARGPDAQDYYEGVYYEEFKEYMTGEAA